MNVSVLAQIVAYLRPHRKVTSIKRVDDNTVNILFDGTNSIYFNLKRGNSYIFKANIRHGYEYKAPFDVILKKRFLRSDVQDIRLLDGDRILQIEVSKRLRYKEQCSILQLEFTSRHTNIIILDLSNIVLEALYHVNKSSSYRQVRVKTKLLPLPKRTHYLKNARATIKDIEHFLFSEYISRQKDTFEKTKSTLISKVSSKIDKLNSNLLSIQSKKDIDFQIDQLKNKTEIVMYALSTKDFVIKDNSVEFMYFGEIRTLDLPSNTKTLQTFLDVLFKQKKRLQRKSKNIHIQVELLNKKLNELKKDRECIKNVSHYEHLKFYANKFSKKQLSSSNKKAQINKANQNVFEYRGFVILAGRNRAQNINILKISKKNDIWIHIKDMSSSHVIVKTDNNRVLTDDVIGFACKLCIRLSVKQKGFYNVCYTKRKYVKILKGSRVTFSNGQSKRIAYE